MKAHVKEDACIGCGTCVAIAESVFQIGDDGLAKVIAEEVVEEEKENVQDAAESCPTSAIEITENEENENK